MSGDVKTVGYGIRHYVFGGAYPTAVQTLSAKNARRFAPHVYSPRIVCLKKKDWRNSHYWLYETVFIIFRLTFFDVNCAFLAVSNFSIATKRLTIV